MEQLQVRDSKSFHELSNDMRAAFLLMCKEMDRPVLVFYNDEDGNHQILTHVKFLNGGSASCEHIVWFGEIEHGLYVSKINCKLAKE